MFKPSVVLLGSKPGAAVVLELMIQKHWKVNYVVPSGTHRFIRGDTLIDVAERYGIRVLPKPQLLGKNVDFVISYMFRDRVTPEILSMANRAAVNFHAAPLPEYGGWAFYNLAILEGATEYGCTCHHMDEGYDSGPLVKVRRFKIDPQLETAVSLERKAQQEMIYLFRDFIDLAESGVELPKIPQDPQKMRYISKKMFDVMKRIHSEADPKEVQRRASAFFYPPYECAYIQLGDTRIEVLPSNAKNDLAERLHHDELTILREAAGLK